jgi:hypothetical protein
MLLVSKRTSDLIRIDEMHELIDPMSSTVTGRDQSGEEEQDPASYPKSELIFPSGEPLPHCWTDPNYRLSRPAVRPSSNDFAAASQDA